MNNRATGLAMTLMVLTTFFSYGCTFSQRKELLDEVKSYAVENGKELLGKAVDAGKAYVAENGKAILASAVDASKEYVEKKLAEKEAVELKSLDSQLAMFKTTDADGLETTKTWKDFDGDKNGRLEEGELTKIAVFVTTQTARKVASGEMSKDEAGKTAKQTGITLAALMAILLGKRMVDKVAKKAPPPGQPAPPTGGPV